MLLHNTLVLSVLLLCIFSSLHVSVPIVATHLKEKTVHTHMFSTIHRFHNNNQNTNNMFGYYLGACFPAVLQFVCKVARVEWRISRRWCVSLRSANSSVIANVSTCHCRCSGEHRILMECSLSTSFHLMNINKDYRQNGEARSYWTRARSRRDNRKTQEVKNVFLVKYDFLKNK